MPMRIKQWIAGALCAAVMALGGCGGPYADRSAPDGETLIVTVHGEATDWQNGLNRFAARIADGAGLAEHAPLESVEDMIVRAEQSAKAGRPVGTLKIWSHGYLGAVHFGRDVLSLETLKGVEHLAVEYDTEAIPPRFRLRLVTESEATRRRDRLAELAESLNRSGGALPRVYLEVCSLGLGRRGRSFVLNLADLLQADVACVSGEHLGIRRFGEWVTARPGESGTPWPVTLVPAEAASDDPRAYYGLESFALRQRTADYEPQLLDKYPATVLRVGEWTVRTGMEGAYGSNCLDDGNTGKGGKEVRYLFVIPNPARLAVRVHVPPAENAAARAPVTIHHAGGITRKTIDQRNAGWHQLGVYRFEAGLYDSAMVVLKNAGTDGHVLADAVRLVTPLDETDVYRANRRAIDTLAADASDDPAEQARMRRRLAGNMVGLDPTDPEYGRLGLEPPVEDRRTAASKAWRSGVLDRFSRDAGVNPEGAE